MRSCTISSRDSLPLLKVLLKLRRRRRRRRRRRSEKMDFYGALYRATWKKDFFLTFSRRDSPAERSCTISSRDSPPLLMVLYWNAAAAAAAAQKKWISTVPSIGPREKKIFFFTFSRRDSPALRSCYSLYCSWQFQKVVSFLHLSKVPNSASKACMTLQINFSTSNVISSSKLKFGISQAHFTFQPITHQNSLAETCHYKSNNELISNFVFLFSHTKH